MTITAPSDSEVSKGPLRIEPAAWPWIGVGLLSLVLFGLQQPAISETFGKLPAWISRYPKALNEEIVTAINWFMDWFVETFRWLFSALSWLLEWPMVGLQAFLQWLPWPATIAAFVVLAFVAGGRKLAVFTFFALLYMVVTGYWLESMNTLALVGVSVPLAIMLGFGLGVWGFRSDRAEKVIQPLLDLMQTVPTFAYLIPILLLFGFGPVVGLIASAIYACPPMVRNVMHGLRRIPPDIVESGTMCGTTRRQKFWWVEVPTALPQIMVGVNQTTMAGLSMVIIAAIIGGFDDIGWEVLSTMRKAQPACRNRDRIDRHGHGQDFVGLHQARTVRPRFSAEFLAAPCSFDVRPRHNGNFCGFGPSACSWFFEDLPAIMADLSCSTHQRCPKCLHRFLWRPA